MQPDQPPTESKKSLPLKWVLIVAIIIIVLGVAGWFMWGKYGAKPTSSKANSKLQGSAASMSHAKPVEQVYINPVSGEKTPLVKAMYYALTVNGVAYYGNLTKINDTFLRLSPTAYSSNGTYLLSGGELHGPESITYLRASAITQLKALDSSVAADASVISLLKSSTSHTTDAYPATDINKYLKNSAWQAFFFKDGTTAFAKTSTLNGPLLANNSSVYTLQATSAGSQTRPQVSLAKMAPEKYQSRTGADLLYWQNMKSDSQVSKAIETFEAQNGKRID